MSTGPRAADRRRRAGGRGHRARRALRRRPADQGGVRRARRAGLGGADALGAAGRCSPTCPARSRGPGRAARPRAAPGRPVTPAGGPAPGWAPLLLVVVGAGGAHAPAVVPAGRAGVVLSSGRAGTGRARHPRQWPGHGAAGSDERQRLGPSAAAARSRGVRRARAPRRGRATRPRRARRAPARPARRGRGSSRPPRRSRRAAPRRSPCRRAAPCPGTTTLPGGEQADHQVQGGRPLHRVAVGAEARHRRAQRRLLDEVAGEHHVGVADPDDARRRRCARDRGAPARPAGRRGRPRGPRRTSRWAARPGWPAMSAPCGSSGRRCGRAPGAPAALGRAGPRPPPRGRSTGSPSYASVKTTLPKVWSKCWWVLTTATTSPAPSRRTRSSATRRLDLGGVGVHDQQTRGRRRRRRR